MFGVTAKRLHKSPQAVFRLKKFIIFHPIYQFWHNMHMNISFLVPYS